MWDHNFRRAVILISEYGPDGVIGFVLNKELAQTLSELSIDLPGMDAPVFHGGPVSRDRLYFLHNVGDLLKGSILVSKGVWFGGDFDQLRFLISTQLIASHNIRFFVGYSGWSVDQLNEEIEDKSWIVENMDANFLFNTEPENLWSRVLQIKGDVYSIIADMKDENHWN